MNSEDVFKEPSAPIHPGKFILENMLAPRGITPSEVADGNDDVSAEDVWDLIEERAKHPKLSVCSAISDELGINKTFIIRLFNLWIDSIKRSEEYEFDKM